MKDFPFYITINGKIFIRQQMLPAHDHVLYICQESQQEVKVRYSEFYSHYEIEGSGRKGEMHSYRVWVEQLRHRDIFMDERFIPQYFTPSQNTILSRAIDSVLAKVWSK